MKDTSLRPILKDKGGIYTIFTILLILTSGGGGGDILEKDGATEKGAVEIEDKAPLHTYIGVSRKFYADLAYFHIVFW